MTSILITGGTGLIGRHLSKRLKEKGYDVAVLSRTRKPDAPIPAYRWDLNNKKIDRKAIDTADYIIHLAGAGIADKRWTKERKQLIIDSRVNSAQLLFDKIKESNKSLSAFISASGINYYGIITSEKIFTETDSPSKDFLGQTCKQWEKAADQFKELGTRVVKIRTGLVLAKEGGALSKMITPVKLGIGSAIGSGKQYMSWIHIDDLCNIYIKAIEDTRMNGAYNAVAPEHITNKEFTRTLALVLNKSFWLPNVPSISMKLLFGKMSDLLLKGSRVSSDKIRNAGYHFLFPDLKSALIDITKK